ncbi:hypothetical protein AMAG_10151 [Allomyces macrogynus ATCC 38327]|uniref:Fork-head domain-containing protein n=1 Tax=Allomyces macrogynus (strain ATCC 38327) TaxID=578462 RepID=A0A0L0SQJ5_ALLM3|nr:hypothetical protein AMAG_10151 [Allomyces macrogynus ATCC 38327]|eukprot:KNE64813.1 hypothetical protein AMAG_10151 [Allomyces macrogynus ATCC 38327]
MNSRSDDCGDPRSGTSGHPGLDQTMARLPTTAASALLEMAGGSAGAGAGARSSNHGSGSDHTLTPAAATWHGQSQPLSVLLHSIDPSPATSTYNASSARPDLSAIQTMLGPMSPSIPSAGDEPQSLDAALAAAAAATTAAATPSATTAAVSPIVLMPSFDGSSSTSTSYPLPPFPNAASLATSTYLAPLPPPPPPPPSHVLAVAPVDATASFGNQLGVPMPLFPVDVPGNSAVPLAPKPAQPSESTERPPFPLATVIAQAVVSTPAKRATLAEIYAWMVETYPYYRFVRLDKTIHHLGKGCYWTLDSVNGPPLLDRPSQRRSGWDDSRRSRARKSSKGVTRVSTDVAAVAAAAAAVGAYPSPASANSSGTTGAAGGVPFMPGMVPATRSDTGSVAPASQPASPAVANVLGVEPGWTQADFSRLLETVATAPPPSTVSTTRPAAAVTLGGQAAAKMAQRAGSQQALTFALPPTASYAHGTGGTYASQHHGHAVPLQQQQSPQHLQVHQPLMQHQAMQHQQSHQTHALMQQQRQYAASALVQSDSANVQQLYGAPIAHYTPNHEHAARPAQAGHVHAATAYVPQQPNQGPAAQYYPSTPHATATGSAATHARSAGTAPVYAAATSYQAPAHQQFYGQRQQQQHHHVAAPPQQSTSHATQPAFLQPTPQHAYQAHAHVHPHAHHHQQPPPPPHPHVSYMSQGAVVVTAPTTAPAYVGAVYAPAPAPRHGGAHQQQLLPDQ